MRSLFSRRGRVRRPLTLGVASAVLLALLTGCVSIPTGGPVLGGREVSEQEPGGVEFRPEGPVAGADQESILRGFVAAFNGSGNYEVARQFLTSGLRADWDPRAGVLVRSGRAGFARLDESTMSYDVTTTASVAPNGTYTALTPASQSLVYQFVQEDGEWRISAAPDGIVLSAGTFTRLFSEHVLYFLDPERRSLVPDLRWFPAGTAPTRVVAALLDGPPAWLQGAVTTAFPDGTQLTSPQRVAVGDSEAVVDLTPEVLESDVRARQLMRAQLEASLGRVGSISSVEIAVGGSPLVIPEGGNLPQPSPQVDNRTLVMRDGEFGYLANDTVATIEDISPQLTAIQATDAVLGASGNVAAALGAAGAYLVRSSENDPLLVDQRSGLISPSLDGYGYLWSVPAGNPSALVAFDGEGGQFPVASMLPANETVVAVSVSRDGARLAVLLSTAAGPRLIVAGIVRDANRNQAPVMLAEPKLDVLVDSMSGTLTRAVDATWQDELSVAVLIGNAGDTAVYSYPIGGQREYLGDPGEAVSIVGGNGESGLRVLTTDGTIAAKRGSGWQAGLGTVQFIATQR